MEEIGTFNTLFRDAETKKIKLESFRQDDFGFFYVCWRSADNVLGADLKRRQPFTALLDSYLTVRDAAAPSQLRLRGRERLAGSLDERRRHELGERAIVPEVVRRR